MAARKGIVLEKGNDWVIVLLPNGEYKKIKTRQYLEVGEFYQENSSSPIKYAVAAVFFLALVLTGIDYYSVQAYAQVSSLAELGVNRWGRVVDVQSKDSNGQLILEKVNVKNDKLELAVEKICSQALNDKNSSNISIHKSEFAVTFAQKPKPALQDKILDKMNQGLKKAVHSQKKDNRNDTIKNNVQDKKALPNEKIPNQKNSQSQLQGSKPDKKNDQKGQRPAELNTNAENPEYHEKQVNKTVPVINKGQQNKHSNIDLKREVEKEKDNSSEYNQQDNGNRH